MLWKKGKTTPNNDFKYKQGITIIIPCYKAAVLWSNIAIILTNMCCIAEVSRTIINKITHQPTKYIHLLKNTYVNGDISVNFH